jgi:hypothetical protein
VLRIAVLLIGVIAVAAVAKAQQPANDDRYVYNTVADGVLRLDLKTGEVSLCNNPQAGWTCRVIPDERAALENEIARLQGDNAALRKALADRGLPLPGGQATGTPLQRPQQPGMAQDPTVDTPRDPEFDRVMSKLERAWRRLVAMMWNLKTELEK